jgi:hypothetical protein
VKWPSDCEDVGHEAEELLGNAILRSEKLVDGAGNQMKENVNSWKPLSSNG